MNYRVSISEILRVEVEVEATDKVDAVCKLRFTETDEELNDAENDAYILKSVETSSKAIVAWGKAINTNARIEERALQVLNMLEEHKEKLYVISDGTRTGLHPLTPSIRGEWFLEKLCFPE